MTGNHGAARVAAATREGPDRSGSVAASIMRAGLLVSLALLVTGAVLGVATGDHPQAVRFTALLGSTDLADRILLLGALMLALTPAVQVAALFVTWWRQGDRRFALVAGGVILLLALGAVVGHG
jgi:uncharacterized membrane protein